MKKFIQINLLLVLLSLGLKAQFPMCNLGIIPDTAFQGQTLTTKITGPYLYMGYGSAPCNPQDIRLNYNPTGFTIYASTMSIINDTVYASWNIPSNAPSGIYDLLVDEYNYDPILGNCQFAPYTCTGYGAFGINVTQVFGHVFYDANQDSVYNTGDLYLSGMNVKKYPTGTWTTTNSNGYYRFIVAPGNYAIKLMANPAIIPVSTDSVNINVGSTSVGPIDFAVRPDSNYFYRKEVYLSGWPRCNTSQSYHAYYYGPTFIPGTLKAKFYHSPNTPFHYSIPAADSSVGDTVYITLPNNNVSSGSIDINIGIPSAGDTVSTSVILETYNWNGQLLGSDTSTLVMQVRCSFDPNDKSVSPAGETQMHYTLFSDSLFYNIRFQNTGNDTAYDILITDTLDPNLDVNSFVLVSASHDVVPEIFQNGLMKFRFYNIMLPDSGTNEPGSHGYINYIVAPKSGLPENTIVTNRAYIYFDQNAPVVTNMTDNTLVSQIPVSIHPVVKSNNFNLYPNPFSYSLTLRSAGAQVLPVVFEVSDAQGRLMKKISISDISTVIDLSGLSSGVYFYRIIGSSDACNEMGRLIKY